METNIVLAGLPMPSGLKSLESFCTQADDDRERHPHILCGMFLPAMGKILTREAQSMANLRLARTALAVERFQLSNGRLPEHLDEISPQFMPAIPVDPFDGAPLRYRRLAKGYLIYSVGSDGQDDNGREKPADWKLTDETSYDITFTVER